MSSHQTKQETNSTGRVNGGGNGGGIRDGVGVRGVGAVGVGEDDGVDDGNMGRGTDYGHPIKA